MDTRFDVGDVVVLNSGGPKMTVREADSSSLQVAWVDDVDNLQLARLPRACVFKVADDSNAG